MKPNFSSSTFLKQIPKNLKLHSKGVSATPFSVMSPPYPYLVHPDNKKAMNNFLFRMMGPVKENQQKKHCYSGVNEKQKGL